MKKQRKNLKSLKLHKETLRLISQVDLENVEGGIYSEPTCFPYICPQQDSSAC
jgi:hypothetical protein